MLSLKEGKIPKPRNKSYLFVIERKSITISRGHTVYTLFFFTFPEKKKGEEERGIRAYWACILCIECVMCFVCGCFVSCVLCCVVLCCVVLCCVVLCCVVLCCVVLCCVVLCCVVLCCVVLCCVVLCCVVLCCVVLCCVVLCALTIQFLNGPTHKLIHYSYAHKEERWGNNIQRNPDIV